MYIITTKDGSHSLFSEKYEEIYHSGNGALQESRHVFIHSGFEYAVQKFKTVITAENPINIFEVGFGTGLNALLSLIAAEQKKVNVYYETIERYPVSLNVIGQLNYVQLLDEGGNGHLFQALHQSEWNAHHDISDRFAFKKNEQSFMEFQLSRDTFHVVYFDAFAPENQPEMWTLEVMQKIYASLVPGGVMVSYCSKSVFRKTLIEAGFLIEKLPGPPGKREMVRAVKFKP